ncbi:hypothetical protein EVA_06462 [gut metagenome]|uniref:Uncharacterized protein n=1 Tax=gut metagenome TaxID=749906 RepID=J9GEU2_9ZZZZ
MQPRSDCYFITLVFIGRIRNIRYSNLSMSKIICNFAIINLKRELS